MTHSNPIRYPSADTSPAKLARRTTGQSKSQSAMEGATVICDSCVTPEDDQNRSRTSRARHIRWAIWGAACLFLFSGCLGRDYNQALRRITYPGQKQAASSDRVVIDTNVRYPSGDHYGLNWTTGNRQTGSSRWTSGRVTYEGRPGTYGRGTYGGRLTGQRTTGQRVTGQRVTGQRVTGQRGYTSRVTDSRPIALPGQGKRRSANAPRIQFRDR